MTIRNPIDQRHANPKATGCPVFWRNFGTPFAWFLAAYPWIAIACMWIVVPIIFLGVIWCREALGIKTNEESLFLFLLPTIGLYVVGLLLLPVGVVWCIVMRIAVNRGLADRGTWWACLVLGGLPASPFLLILLTLLVALGDRKSVV